MSLGDVLLAARDCFRGVQQSLPPGLIPHSQQPLTCPGSRNHAWTSLEPASKSLPEYNRENDTLNNAAIYSGFQAMYTTLECIAWRWPATPQIDPVIVFLESLHRSHIGRLTRNKRHSVSLTDCRSLKMKLLKKWHVSIPHLKMRIVTRQVSYMGGRRTRRPPPPPRPVIVFRIRDKAEEINVFSEWAAGRAGKGRGSIDPITAILLSQV